MTKKGMKALEVYPTEFFTLVKAIEVSTQQTKYIMLEAEKRKKEDFIVKREF